MCHADELQRNYKFHHMFKVQLQLGGIGFDLIKVDEQHALHRVWLNNWNGIFNLHYLVFYSIALVFTIKKGWNSAVYMRWCPSLAFLPNVQAHRILSPSCWVFTKYSLKGDRSSQLHSLAPQNIFLSRAPPLLYATRGPNHIVLTLWQRLSNQGWVMTRQTSMPWSQLSN